ncbi:t62 [Tupaiid betaherpesvirus 1]|uniref:T62 n=1 Tax=Tupaiid herpesvirus 1 (strain 1) TaxID=10397 RepID=Q91TM9_TUHV1|nr:t62 [Tupaiid betaherpesvirus 1]AAK57111.1 t62 [Tupaiid betaherpesvirus 1]
MEKTSGSFSRRLLGLCAVRDRGRRRGVAGRRARARGTRAWARGTRARRSGSWGFAAGAKDPRAGGAPRVGSAPRRVPNPWAARHTARRQSVT